ncbi:ABC transporter permease [Paraburkholderia caballeronis]|uniref:Putative spermidine/putrescine transport system permease protein n=1 Tax=Paraburkholderia caballeronis TaxID=416943 RepID=A0A1H7MRP2_9BURK|nr:ABC transporter permease [Paraburkholderia caballeronis]PXW26454.1 putative spermidine/putrescine transport system permease protein [Paraburkholderia caballeronis]PXX02001.1 putative spermidine/putrescine transport system permease protein [Paraburkholderia caballeronis]RAK01158.1 putative spermidine/putrescine transport system permease protein [Paraburkholderia caballeronis]TDV16276.1 putative spermidine/putrescine transport system permease protein [Paraburkholderia caballeronis]TDV20626.1 
MHDLTFPLRWRVALVAPALAVFCAFWLLPMVALVQVSADGHLLDTYRALLTNGRYMRSLAATVLLSAAVTATTLVLSVICGLLLARRAFPGRRTLVALLTFPLAFPGVVVGFMVIMLAGRQGLIGALALRFTGERWVFAYSMAGLFAGYLYFSIPRVVVTVMACVSQLDASLEEAARSLGASPWRIMRDVILPALAPGLIAAGAVCFATAMGAFGTAFTLATDIDVLPMTIYTEFTLNANMVTAAGLSIVLGFVTWAVLTVARTLTGATVAATA